MVPDKIYLCADAPRMYDWSNLPFEKGGNIEYIRKDALLEWAKSKKARLKQGHKHDWKNDDTINGGKLMLDELINKLNSM